MIRNQTKLHPLFIKYKADFMYCENIIKQKSKSFYAAFTQLPQEKAFSVYAIYAFCREADDSIDVYRNVAQLEKLEQELLSFQQGNVPDRPLWRALYVVFQLFPMDFLPFFDMIKGQKMDIEYKQPITQEALETYCYYVASTVGLMLLPLLSRQPQKIREQAKALGIAMQLTNILRDVGEDSCNGRIYLPEERMRHFGYTHAELKARELSASFIELWEFEATRAEDLYQFSLTIFPLLEEDCRKPVYLALLFYKEILIVVREKKYDCFNQRQFVSKARKIALYQEMKNYLKGVERNE